MRTFTLPLTFTWTPYAGTRTDWDRIRNSFFTAEVFQTEDGTWTWGVETRDDIVTKYNYPTREAAQQAAEAKLVELFTRVVL